MDNPEKQTEIRPYGLFTEAIKEVIGFVRKELILRGIFFLLLGLLIMFAPGQTLLVITISIGVFILLDGLAMLFPALKYRGKGKFWLILHAVFFMLLGLFTCTAPLKMDIIWVVMIGFWQFFSGLQCISFWKTAGSSAIFSGICSIIAGLVLIFMPLLGLMTLMWIMGLFSFICGFSEILLGIRLKKITKETSAQ